jgi:hypothetical protein
MAFIGDPIHQRASVGTQKYQREKNFARPDSGAHCESENSSAFRAETRKLLSGFF